MAARMNTAAKHDHWERVLVVLGNHCGRERPAQIRQLCKASQAIFDTSIKAMSVKVAASDSDFCNDMRRMCNLFGRAVSLRKLSITFQSTGHFLTHIPLYMTCDKLQKLEHLTLEVPKGNMYWPAGLSLPKLQSLVLRGKSIANPQWKIDGFTQLTRLEVYGDKLVDWPQALRLPSLSTPDRVAPPGVKLHFTDDYGEGCSLTDLLDKSTSASLS